MCFQLFYVKVCSSNDIHISHSVDSLLNFLRNLGIVAGLSLKNGVESKRTQFVPLPPEVPNIQSPSVSDFTGLHKNAHLILFESILIHLLVDLINYQLLLILDVEWQASRVIVLILSLLDQCIAQVYHHPHQSAVFNCLVNQRVNFVDEFTNPLLEFLLLHSHLVSKVQFWRVSEGVQCVGEALATDSNYIIGHYDLLHSTRDNYTLAEQDFSR